MFKEFKCQAAMNDENELYNESGATKEEGEGLEGEKEKLGEEDDDELGLKKDDEEENNKDNSSDGDEDY